jgi:hypothetical protein
MVHSDAYHNNTAWRTWLQNFVSYMLDLRQAGRINEPSPADQDPNWYTNILLTYNITGVIYNQDWIAEVEAQKQARNL